MNTEIKVLENNKMSLLSNRETKSNELQKQQLEISSLQSEFDYKQLEDEILSLNC